MKASQILSLPFLASLAAAGILNIDAHFGTTGCDDSCPSTLVHLNMTNDGSCVTTPSPYLSVHFLDADDDITDGHSFLEFFVGPNCDRSFGPPLASIPEQFCLWFTDSAPLNSLRLTRNSTASPCAASK